MLKLTTAFAGMLLAAAAMFTMTGTSIQSVADDEGAAIQGGQTNCSGYTLQQFGQLSARFHQHLSDYRDLEFARYKLRYCQHLHGDLLCLRRLHGLMRPGEGKYFLHARLRELSPVGEPADHTAS
jgi:hypothetical protein